MNTQEKPATTSGSKDTKKQRLSSALRDNLRRRKAAPRPGKPEPQGDARKK